MFVEINGLCLSEPAQAYRLLCQALLGKTASNKTSAERLESYFVGLEGTESSDSVTRPWCIVLLDELDWLITRNQTIIYNFFDWPSQKHSRLIVVAIANTMDLPERMLKQRVASRLGVTRINFLPYTHQELMTIVRWRLRPEDTGADAGSTQVRASDFDPDALELCARKVSSVSGDVRRILEICRRAKALRDRSCGKRTDAKVAIEHMDQVLKEMFESGTVLALQTASLHERLFVCAVRAEIRRTSCADVEFKDVAERHRTLCRLHELDPLSRTCLAAICARLACFRILLAEHPKVGSSQKISLNVTDDDVVFSFKNDEFLRRFL